MRPVIKNRPRLDPVIAETLDGIVTPIQAGWGKQHHGDGSHTDITATSAAISGLTVLGGKVRLSYAEWYDDAVAGLHNVTTQPTRGNIHEVSWLRIYPAQSLGADLEIAGIDATGREAGDLLLVSNVGSEGAGNDILFHLEDTSVALAAGSRFMPATNGPASPYRLQAGRAVWLVYDFYFTSATSARVPRWRIVDLA